MSNQDRHKIDEQIIKLLEKRVRLISKLKNSKSSFSQNFRFPSPSARSDIIDKKIINRLFQDTFDQACKDLKVKIAYLGPDGTFSHQAAWTIFGKSGEFCSQDTIMDIFNTVEQGKSLYGIVPIENSVEGSVNLTLDLLKDSDLWIYGEKTIKISHNLISLGMPKDIKEIYSHPQVLAQCRNWLKINYPKAHQIETSSSSAAVKKLKKSLSKAAIGTLLAAKISGIPVLTEDIQDSKSNKTRFLILSRKKRKKGKLNKTSLVFLCHDKPGALVSVLKIFKQFDINLTKIESRPSKRKDWEYYFYVDMLGHEKDKIIRAVLSKIEEKTIFVKILGSHPINEW